MRDYYMIKGVNMTEAKWVGMYSGCHSSRMGDGMIDLPIKVKRMMVRRTCDNNNNTHKTIVILLKKV
jgi:hypothetical protein